VRAFSKEPPPGWDPQLRWPPITPSLDDAFDKLRWAKKHLETLREEIEPFEQRDTHSITVEVDADAGKYTFYVHGLDAIPDPDWGLIVGDCLHNGRTALDYLMVRLFALVTGKDPRYIGRVQFPISDSPGSFDSSPSVSQMRKHPEFKGYLARIEELQPFNTGNISIWGARDPAPSSGQLFPSPVIHALPQALNRLSSLDNLDKHRIIHTAWVGVRIEDFETFRIPRPISNSLVARLMSALWKRAQKSAV
jgi:hypothetical protein